MQCQNNLKQIGLGLHNYVDVNRHFPSGTMPSNGLAPEQRLSWQVAILPYVEQAAICNRIDASCAWNAEQNRTAITAVIPLFLCPAQPGFSGPPGPNATHYVGLAGAGAESALLAKEDPNAGFFGYDRVIRPDDVQDGMSFTAAVIETTAGNGPWAAGEFSTVRGLDTLETAYIAADGPFGMKHKRDTWFRTNPVIANTLLADGSVRPLVPDLSAQALRALATIAGGEPPQSDF